jgi:hypothetical protein
MEVQSLREITSWGVREQNKKKLITTVLDIKKSQNTP